MNQGSPKDIPDKIVCQFWHRQGARLLVRGFSKENSLTHLSEIVFYCHKIKVFSTNMLILGGTRVGTSRYSYLHGLSHTIAAKSKQEDGSLIYCHLNGILKKIVKLVS